MNTATSIVLAESIEAAKVIYERLIDICTFLVCQARQYDVTQAYPLQTGVPFSKSASSRLSTY
jgi:hypothetical protein